MLLLKSLLSYNSVIVVNTIVKITQTNCAYSLAMHFWLLDNNCSTNKEQTPPGVGKTPTTPIWVADLAAAVDGGNLMGKSAIVLPTRGDMYHIFLWEFRHNFTNALGTGINGY